MKSHALERNSRGVLGSTDVRSVVLVTFHALALVLFAYKPVFGAALLFTGLVLAMGLSRPLYLAIVALGLLWVNDVISDFSPFSRLTAWKDAILIVLIMGWLVRSVLRHQPLVIRSEMTLPLLVVIANYLVMCVSSPGPQFAILGLKATIFYMMWFFVIPEIVETKEDVRNLVVAVLFGTFCIGLYNLWRVQQPLGTFPPLRNGKIYPGALQAHFSGSGYILPSGLILAVALLPVARGWQRGLLFVVIGVATAGLLGTFGRAHWLTTLVALTAIAFVGRRYRELALIFVLGMVLAGVLQTQAQFTIAERAESAFDTSDRSRNEREAETSSVTIPFVLQHPFGVGTGTMTAVGSAAVWSSGGADMDFVINHGIIHNSFLLVAIEIGWIGVLAYAALLLTAMRSAYRFHRAARDPLLKAIGLGLFGITVSFTCMQFFAPMITAQLISFSIWAFFGLIAVLPYLDEQTALEPEREPLRIPAAV